jgi:hypothetical protein
MFEGHLAAVLPRRPFNEADQHEFKVAPRGVAAGQTSSAENYLALIPPQTYDFTDVLWAGSQIFPNDGSFPIKYDDLVIPEPDRDLFSTKSSPLLDNVSPCSDLTVSNSYLKERTIASHTCLE